MTLLQVLGSIVHCLEAASSSAPTSNVDEKLKAAEKTISDLRNELVTSQQLASSLQRMLSDSEQSTRHAYDLLKSTQFMCPHIGAKYQ